MYTSKRTNLSDSFNVNELKEIMKREARRPIIEEKRMVELIDYSLVVTWLQQIGIEKENPFENDITLEKIFSYGNKIHTIIGEKTLKNLPENPLLQKTLSIITKYLGEEKIPKKSDVIFVFGGKSLIRIERAVELWKQNVSDTIMISGKGPIYGNNKTSEAEIFAKWAINKGVPHEKLIIEPNSITIADNIRRSLNVLDDKKIRFQSIVLIIGWYAQKRAWMMMEKYVKKDVTLFYTHPKHKMITEKNWMKSEYGIKIIFNEFFKMRVHDYLVFNRIV